MKSPDSDPADRFVPLSERVRDDADQAPPGGAWKRGELACLLGITALAGLLRLWHLEQWSVAATEAMTWQAATLAGRGDFDLIASALRLLFDSGLLPLHGEGWLRLPFAFFGLITVPLLALVGAAFVGRPAALLAAGLLAVQPWHVELSQTATGHGPAVACGLVGLGAAWIGRASGSVAAWLMALVAIVAAGLCHPAGWLTCHVLLACWRLHDWRNADRRDRIHAVLGAVVVVIASIAVVLALRPGQMIAASPGAAFVVGWEVVRAIALSVLALAVVPVLTWRGERFPRRCLLLAAAVPGVLLFLLGLTAAPIDADAFLGCLPPLLLLAAAGGVTAFERLRAALGGGRAAAVLVPSSLVAVVVLLDLAVGSFLYATARRGSRPDWRGARDVVVGRAERANLAVLAAAGNAGLLYYLRPNHWRGDRVDPHPGIAVLPMVAGAAQLPVFAGAARARQADLFVIALEAERAAMRRDRESWTLIQESFELIEVLPCAGASHDETVYVWRLVEPADK